MTDGEDVLYRRLSPEDRLGAVERELDQLRASLATMATIVERLTSIFERYMDLRIAMLTVDDEDEDV